MRRVRPRTVLAWSALLAIAACNGIWGIDDGKLGQPDAPQAGAPAAEPGGGAPPDAAGAKAPVAGHAGESTGGAGPSAGGAGGDDTPAGGMSGANNGNGGSMTSGGSVSGSAGSMSGSGGSGGAPSCSGCKLGQVDTGTQTCGRCNSGSQTRHRTCDAKCTYGAWSAWSVCSQCDDKPYRCCGSHKWEWCYDSDCAWTKDCAACAASSCPEC